MDQWLAGCLLVVGVFVFDGGAHPESGLAPFAVVEDFQVFEDSDCEFETGLPASSVQQFDLHTSPEQFHEGVVEAVSDGSHRPNGPGLMGSLGNAQDATWVPWSECITVP